MFLGPILALVLFNTFVCVLVVRVLIKHATRKLRDVKDSKKVKGVFKTLISVLSIMSMFGLQWLFGALTIAEASPVFQWIFILCSTLQGFFLFIFFCVLGKDVRDEWLNLLTCGKRKQLPRSGASTSRVGKSGQTSATRRTGTTYMYQSSTLMRAPDSSILASTTDSSVELAAMNPIPDEPTKKMHAIAEEEETVIANGNTDIPNGQPEKVDLSKESPVDEEPDFQVPPHILERRGRCAMNEYEPAPSVLPPALSQEKLSDTSTEYIGGDLTQMTDLSSDNDLSYL